MKNRIFALLLVICLLSTSAAAAGVGSDVSLSALARAEFADTVVTADGKVLACDTWNKVIWDLSGETPSLYAGRIGVSDLSGEPMGRYFDASDRLRAFFLEPTAIVPFLDGYAVTDASANVVRYVTKTSVRTLGGSGKEGEKNGVGAAVRFSHPTGLAVDENGTLYIADTGNGCIRTMTKKGRVSTLYSGLSEPTGLCWQGGALFVAETGKNRVIRLTDGKFEVVAGRTVAAEEQGVYYGGFVNGPAEKAEFDHPQGVAVTEDGTVYVADTLNNAIRMVKNGRVYTVAHSEDMLSAPVKPCGLMVSSNKVLASCRGIVMTLDAPSAKFTDVKSGDWFAPYAGEAALRRLVLGTTEMTFSPAVLTNRAQFAVMLGRLQSQCDGSMVIDGDAALADIADDTWYTAAARWAVDKGIILGINGSFEPSGSLTREQAAVMLWRYAEMTGLNVNDLDDIDLASSFSDSAQVSGWAQEAMRWAVGKGILTGADGALTPLAQIDRAQTAAILLRFMDVYGL